MSADLECNVTLFPDYTSMFTVFHNPNAASEKINLNDLALVSQWAHEWSISFNHDLQKQAVELWLSKKRLAVDHPVVLFNNIPVKRVEEHKHPGCIFIPHFMKIWKSFIPPAQLTPLQLSTKE